MLELWYVIAAAMLVAYVVLDGYDFGAGIVHLWVARNNQERRQVLAAIGPYWDGNEVWLLAAGGALFVAFPRVLSAGISGFYFAIFLVLWSLILRGIAIEFRSHVSDTMWRATWDFLFAAASVLLALFFGVALGNLVRGVPLNDAGWFSLPLFTNFSPRGEAGILDWYTVGAGLLAVMALAAHGAAFLIWRTGGAVQQRARLAARRLSFAAEVLWLLMFLATHSLNDVLTVMGQRPLGILGVAIAIAGIVAIHRGLARQSELTPFLGSTAFLGGTLMATAACLFPVMIKSISNPALSITVHTGGGDEAGLRTALVWFAVGFPLVIGYFVLNFRLHRGKAVAAADGEGY
ncbi:MAG: cytochrome d ubiquinol oxidase subunit II [Bryobacterales bacterium]|nr:cytochrome d ubiquinol oxidase subunit II [Bryobacterales bacterium]